MIYTIDRYKIYKFNYVCESYSWTEAIYASTDEHEANEYFKNLCNQTETINVDYFIEYNMFEWTKPDLKCLLDTWNNGYKKKE